MLRSGRMGARGAGPAAGGRGRRGRIGFAVAALLAGLAADAGAATASEGHDEVVVRHRVGASESTKGYWTPERMRRSAPADALLPAGSSAFRWDSESLEPRSHPTSYSSDELSDTGSFPNVVHGKVFSFDEELGVERHCSGTLVEAANRSVVITAAHCMHSGPPGGVFEGSGYHQEWSFAPGYPNGAGAPIEAVELLVLGGFASEENQRLDVGAAVLARDGKGRWLQDVHGGRAIAFNQPRDQAYRAYGYPSASPFDGRSLWACDSAYGGDDPDPAPPGTSGAGPDPISIGCDMNQGASGGGWVGGQGTLASVSAYGRSNHPEIVYGPYFGESVKALYDAAAAVDTGVGTTCRGRPVAQLGGRSRDRFEGTADADVIRVLGGSDRVKAQGGHDRVCGNGGRDKLKGGGGRDRLFGGGGKDRLVGGVGNDRLVGGSGRDVCIGGRCKDRARGCERMKGIG